jgi:hypothetical protein
MQLDIYSLVVALISSHQVTAPKAKAVAGEADVPFFSMKPGMECRHTDGWMKKSCTSRKRRLTSHDL